MAHPADKSDEEIREATETLKGVADEIEKEGSVQRTIASQEKAEQTVAGDEEADDESTDAASGKLPMGGFGRASSGQQN